MSYPPFTSISSTNKFPLGVTYSSRVQQNIEKNYVLLGFKPGFPLQASELNEMCELNALQNTLMYEMNKNWSSPPVGITLSAALPAWDGAVPVKPTGWTITGTTTKTYTLSKGWLYVKKPEFLGGLGFWIWNAADRSFDITGTPAALNPVYHGILIEYKEVTASNDQTLKDNSGRTIFTNTSDYGNGADRIQITITGTANYLKNATIPTNFMPILEHRLVTGTTSKVYYPNMYREITTG
jgi:hypothetical protein